jgi:hypothetical protein
MADVDGKWRVQVATLAGARRYDVTLTTAGTAVTGTAVGATGPVPIRNGTAVGDTVNFTLDLRAPLRMSLVFSVRVTGDQMTGTARSGPFPASTVVGTRTP